MKVGGGVYLCVRVCVFVWTVDSLTMRSVAIYILKNSMIGALERIWKEAILVKSKYQAFPWRD